jgi:hypothetical protein
MYIHILCCIKLYYNIWYYILLYNIYIYITTKHIYTQIAINHTPHSYKPLLSRWAPGIFPDDGTRSDLVRAFGRAAAMAPEPWAGLRIAPGVAV